LCQILDAEFAAMSRLNLSSNLAHAATVSGKEISRPDTEPFIAMQRWLALAGARKVVVPFAADLIMGIPANAVRMRRDARQLLACIEVTALLHQCQRRHNENGAVIATLDDYAIARRLLAPVFDAVVAEGLTPAIRETVEAIAEDEEISGAQLAARLSLARSTISHRVTQAMKKGFLENRESGRGKQARYARAAPLPEERSALPTVVMLAKALRNELPDKGVDDEEEELAHLPPAPARPTGRCADCGSSTTSSVGMCSRCEDREFAFHRLGTAVAAS
jgi:DNA-binding MarR family transcriptional regulator